jgi:hypothetical protein
MRLAKLNLIQTTMPTIKGNKMHEKRLEERERIFGNCEGEVWSYKNEKGYAPIPRVLPLVMHLLTKEGVKSKGNPARVYFDLWTRSFEAGFVKLDDEDSAAFSAGYDGQRGTRTWREHMKFLEQQGFIKTQKNGIKAFGYVLLVNPFLVVARKIRKGGLDASWIAAFVSRCSEIGAVLPEELQVVLKGWQKKH